MRCARIAAIVALFFAGCQARAEEAKPEARETLDTAIAEGIRLLEAKSYDAFLKAFVPPDDLKKLADKHPLGEFTEKFGEKKGPHLLLILKSLKDAKPKLEDDGKKATFDVPKDLATTKPAITFVQIGKYWYIQN